MRFDLSLDLRNLAGAKPMFLDYCPWPCNVVKTSEEAQEIVPLILDGKIIEIKLERYIYPIGDIYCSSGKFHDHCNDNGLVARYGWEPLTRTVVVSSGMKVDFWDYWRSSIHPSYPFYSQLAKGLLPIRNKKLWFSTLEIARRLKIPSNIAQMAVDHLVRVGRAYYKRRKYKLVNPYKEERDLRLDYNHPWIVGI